MSHGDLMSHNYRLNFDTHIYQRPLSLREPLNQTTCLCVIMLFKKMGFCLDVKKLVYLHFLRGHKLMTHENKNYNNSWRLLLITSMLNISLPGK